jgi:hypothetical protein
VLWEDFKSSDYKQEITKTIFNKIITQIIGEAKKDRLGIFNYYGIKFI